MSPVKSIGALASVVHLPFDAASREGLTIAVRLFAKLAGGWLAIDGRPQSFAIETQSDQLKQLDQAVLSVVRARRSDEDVSAQWEGVTQELMQQYEVQVEPRLLAGLPFELLADHELQALVQSAPMSP